MLVRTTRIDKREEFMKVKLLKPLRALVTVSDGEVRLSPELFSLSIQYRFISRLGSTFEAVLCQAEAGEEEVVISSSDIVPRGVAVSTEDFVVGVVMRHTESFQSSSAAHSVTKSNKINEILHRYLFVVIILNAFLMVCIFVVNMILTTYASVHAA